jgi:hypothetical protein
MFHTNLLWVARQNHLSGFLLYMGFSFLFFWDFDFNSIRAQDIHTKLNALVANEKAIRCGD